MTESKSPLTPQERSLRATIAANTSWAKTEDRAARTANARAALREKFYDEVDPERKLPPAEREKRAENARKAYYARIALKAATAARKRREAAGKGKRSRANGAA